MAWSRKPCSAFVSEPVLVRFGGGEVVGDSSDRRVEIPGSPPPPHPHRHHVESFYVLEGELTFTAGGSELRAEAGSWVRIPPGVPHTFALSGDRSVHFLNVHTPSCGFGDFLRSLDQARRNHRGA